MDILIYIAKVNFFWILFYCCYRLFLSRNTFFVLNRFYLVGTLLLSFALPFISFTEIVQDVPVTDQVTASLTSLPVAGPAQQQWDWTLVLLFVYLAGLSYMLLRLAKGLYNLYQLILLGDRTKCADFTLVILPENVSGAQRIGSFSFFNWLVVPGHDYEHCFDTIFQHEHVHMRQYHSFDILLIELLKVVFWFNPVLWAYTVSIRALHEFLADTHAQNRDSYAEFLFYYAQNMPLNILSNHFSNASLLEERVKMIYKNRTPSSQLYKYMLIIPLIALAVALTASRKRIIVTQKADTQVAMQEVQDQQNEKEMIEPVSATDQAVVKSKQASKPRSQGISKRNGTAEIPVVQDSLKQRKLTKALNFHNFKAKALHTAPLNPYFPTVKESEVATDFWDKEAPTADFYRNTNGGGYMTVSWGFTSPWPYPPVKIETFSMPK